MSRIRSVESDLEHLLSLVTGPNRPGHYSPAELRDRAVEYLDDYDEELERYPEQRTESHWNLWMDDADLNDALFVVLIVRPSGLSIFCGRGESYPIRRFAEHWVGDVEGLEAEFRQRFAIPADLVQVDRTTAEGWLGRSLGVA